jgi:hypothetical protein
MPARRRVVLLLAAGIGLIGSPATAAGVEPIVGPPLPAEPPATVLPNRAMDAMAFDVDGDGVRELLTVNAAAVAQGLVAVQAWWVDADGAAEPSNQVPVRRSASVDEQLLSRGLLGIDRDFMVAVRTDEPAKLMVAERDGREVALVAAIGTNPEFPLACCLTVWEVVLEGPAELDLRLVAETQNFASELVAADMDADGTDELFILEGTVSDLDETLEASVLRWNEERYSRIAFTVPTLSGFSTSLAAAGETDGVSGDDVLLSGSGIGPQGQPNLHRVTLRDGQPFVEGSGLEEVAAAHVVSLESGPGFVTSAGFLLQRWSWPRDAALTEVANRASNGLPAAVFGTGTETRIIMASEFQPGSVDIVDGALGPGLSTVVGRDLRGGSFSSVPLTTEDSPELVPFFGVVPGGMPRTPDAYLFYGQLVRPVPDRIVLGEATPVALLPGLEPMGTVGPGGAWIGLLEGFSGFLFGRGTATNMQFTHPPAALRVVATASVLEPEADDANLEPTFLGVAPDPDHPTAFIVGNEAAEAEIVGPPGTWIRWSTRGGTNEVSIGSEGTARLLLLPPAGPNAPEGSGATVNIWLVTPAGHGYSGTWRIRVYRVPPSLAIQDEGAILNFSPTLSGRTAPDSTVTVNGFAVDVAENGTFEAPLMVGLLPSDVRVVVTDPVGNRTERVVSVVWPVDYRRLPFVPFAVLLTVAAALVLFLRRPDIGPPTRRTPDDGATFEEIGG